MKTSIIIPTLNRQSRVKHLLSSIFENRELPDEIIIIEQGDEKETKSVIQTFLEFSVPIKLFFQEEKSVAVARNRGVKESSGDVLIFLDDDMEIAESYIEVAKQYLLSHTGALGIAGTYMSSEPAWTIKRIIAVVFGIYSWQARNIVLSSGSYDYIRGDNTAKEQAVEWLYGGNMIFRRAVFEQGFSFENSFKRWSFGEDVMLSYQIFKKYPGSLWYVPTLLVKHLQGMEEKLLNTQALKMKIIYRYFFWKREVWNGKFLHTLAYLWSQLGLAGLELLQYPSLATTITLCKSYGYLIQHRKQIAKQTIDFNKFILS